MPADLIRVLLADDHAVVRAGLKAVLGTAKDIDVVGEARNGREAVDAAMRLNPDVVVMDLSMDEMDGAAATRELRSRGSNAKILILTMHAEDEQLVPLLAAGAEWVSREERSRPRPRGRGAYGGARRPVSPGRRGARWPSELRRREEHASERDQFEALSEREQAILRLIAAGYTSPEIGEQLHISPKTVDTYKQRVNEKIGLAHRADYVRFAMKLGLLDA